MSARGWRPASFRSPEGRSISPSSPLPAAGEPLGCYVLPGGVSDPAQGIGQAQDAERLGLGAVWIGERYDTKDLPSLAGAIGQATARVRIGAAVTSPGLRHPMVLASLGQTLQALTGGRFTLGLGRSAAWRWRAYGVAAPTLASMGDTAVILRRLWAGETVRYTGPAGTFPELRLAQRAAVAPPRLLLAAVGPRTLALAGSHFDGALLHPLLTPDAVARSVALARAGAESVGRDPDAVCCVAAVVTACDVDAAATDLAIRARAAGYFHVAGLGDALVAANGWDRRALAAYRDLPVFAGLEGRQADKVLSRAQLVESSRSLPDAWIAEASVAGDGPRCAARLHVYLDAGADELILHGSTPADYATLAAAFRR
jgi:5,10-methylenetetrahydromethanopterin reductase